jgi:16S rRNA (adenine1518-N6/adenine1519-N6)-dimethyltransferase
LRRIFLPRDKVVEIGPGLGSLTLGLLEKVNALAVIEFDSRLADRLKQTLDQRASGHKCHIISADAMNVTELPFEPDALVANLPYNIFSSGTSALYGNLPKPWKRVWF